MPVEVQVDEVAEGVAPTWPAVRRLLGLARPYWKPLAGATALTLLGTVVNLSLPLVARGALDRALAVRSVALVDQLAWLLVGLILASSAVGFAQFFLISRTGNRIVTDLRHTLFEHLQRLPAAYFDRKRSGDLASHLSNDVGLVQTTLTSDVASLLGNVLTLVGGIALAVYIDWRLTLVVVAILAGIMSVFVVFGAWLRRLTRESLEALAETMGAMTEALANNRLVKAFAREPYESSRARELLERVFRLNVKASVAEAVIGTFAFSGFILLMLGVVWYGGRQVMLGHLSPGSLLAFFMTVTIIAGPMGSLASLYSRLQRAVGAADRIFGVLDEAPEPADAPDAGGFPPGPVAVRFRDVAFAYREGVPVLRGLTLEAAAGRVTALVGPSGSGKTTTASLLYRFYEVDGGTIEIVGDHGPVELGAIRRQALREAIGLVPQEPILFDGTIRDNIRYGRLDASDEEVERAAKLANVEEFVRDLPEGYATKLGERGVTLSGGQRQRVAIARAILKDPRILVLDEATSALDNRSEALVKEALARLMEGRTTLVIAHRLTTVQGADQIAVLDRGEVVEVGTHAELIGRRGLYAELASALVADR